MRNLKKKGGGKKEENEEKEMKMKYLKVKERGRRR
jgi:hypothetical protein